MNDDSKKPEAGNPPLPLPHAQPKNVVGPTGPGRATEGLAGFLSYFAMLGFGWLLVAQFSAVPYTLLIPMIILVIAAIYVHARLGWHGFTQGVFIGLGFSCLIGFSVCFYSVNHH